jgi:hypothetical protein
MVYAEHLLSSWEREMLVCAGQGVHMINTQ